MWHVIRDTWRVTCDMWHTGGSEHCLTISAFFSNSMGYTEFWRYFHKPSVNPLISNIGVCRTALATPGLLTSFQYICWKAKVALAHFPPFITQIYLLFSKVTPVQGVSSQEIFSRAQAWARLKNCFISEPEPGLARNSHFLPSPSRAQLGYPTCFQAQAKPGSDFKFVTEPSRARPAQTF